MIDYLILLGYMMFFYIVIFINLNDDDDGDYTGGIY